MAIVTWSNTFNTTPVFSDLVSDGDNRILDNRQTIRASFMVEHDIGDATVDADYLDTGRHKTGSARSYFQSAAPSDLLKHTNAGAWPPVSPGNDEDDKLASSDLDNGRLWVDWDDCQPYVREEEQTAAAWTDINANHGTPNPTWISLWPRFDFDTSVANNTSQNAAVINTREPIDGAENFGAAPMNAVMGAEIVVPNDGRDYVIEVEAFISYAIDANVAGADTWMGFWLVEDPNGAGNQDRDVRLVGASSHDQGLSDGVTLTYISGAAVTNGGTYDYWVDFAATSIAVAAAHVNPHDAQAPTPNLIGAFNGISSLSRIKAKLVPYYDVTSYTVDS
jgi:hypothetical protein